MANFTRIDENNIVIHSINLDDDKCINPETNEIDFSYGEIYCNETYGGRWIHSYVFDCMQEQSIEECKKHAQLGDRYNEDHDAFIGPQPHLSWYLNDKCEWTAPIPKPSLKEGKESGEVPDKAFYVWDEELYQSDNTKGWVVKYFAEVKLEQLGLTSDELKIILGL